MLTGLLRYLAPFIADSRVILSVVAMLCAWAAYSGIGFARASVKLVRRFNDARRRLNKAPDSLAFTIQYENISQEIDQIPLIGPSWRGFSQSLIIPPRADRPVTATSNPRRWFDLPDLFRHAGADLRYQAALPGLLVGAGLLFTFLGLAAALSAAGAVVAEGVDQAQRNAALRDLLGAASAKFITSLAGLALSIIYALYRKSRLKAAERAYSAFFMSLQQLVPFRTTAFLQAEANALLERQYTEIQQIGTDFFVNLGSTLEREFNGGLQQHIAPLAHAVDKLSAHMASQNEDAMQGMLQAFLARLEGAVGETMRSTAATLEALGGRLDGLQGGMDAAAQKIGRAAEEMTAGMGRGTERALGGITEQMGALVSSLREAADEAGRNNRAAGDDLSRQMAQTASALTAAVAAFQRRMEDGAAEGIGRLSAPIEALLLQLRDMSAQQREAGAQASTALAATIGRAADALEATATKVAGVLGGGAADASARLVAATEAMRADLRAVLDQFGNELAGSGRILAQSAASGSESLRDAASTLGSGIEALSERLREAGEAAGASLRDGASEGRAGMTDAARTLVQGGHALTDRLAALGAAAAELAARTADLDQAGRAMASPLLTGAQEMRAAGEAARDAARPMQDAARAVVGSMEALAGAAAAMATAQGQADQLAARLGAAADRFDGVDRNVAGTLEKLNNGLREYQQSIVRFFEQMDQGLARSVSGLTSVATTLESTVDELADRLPQGASVS